MLRTVPIVVALLSSAAAAHAQAPAASFAELAKRLKAGQGVSVTTESGQVIRGEVDRVTDTTLTLKGGKGDLSARDVQRISRRTSFKRRGALVGLGVGFALGAILAAAEDCRGSFAPCFSGAEGAFGMGGLMGLWGAGVGTVVGASIHKERVVFSRAPGGSASTAIAPY